MAWLYFAMKPGSSEEIEETIQRQVTGVQKAGAGESGDTVFKRRTVASWDSSSWILETEQLIRIWGIYRWLFLTKQRLCWPFCIFHQKCIKFPVPEDQCVWLRLPRLDPKLLVLKWKIMGLVFLLIFFFFNSSCLYSTLYVSVCLWETENSKKKLEKIIFQL